MLPRFSLFVYLFIGICMCGGGGTGGRGVRRLRFYFKIHTPHRHLNNLRCSSFMSIKVSCLEPEPAPRHFYCILGLYRQGRNESAWSRHFTGLILHDWGGTHTHYTHTNVCMSIHTYTLTHILYVHAYAYTHTQIQTQIYTHS